MSMALAVIGTMGVATLSGCYLAVDADYYDDEYGDVVISYTFDGLPCDRADVDRIEISLVGEVYGDAYYDTLDCGRFRDGVIVYDMYSDQYELIVVGLSADGRALYSMERPRSLYVAPGTQNEVLVYLLSATGSLGVSWSFSGTAGCGEVVDVRVTLRDPSGALYDDARHPCDSGGVEYVFLEPGRWTVELQALNDVGRVIFRLAAREIVVEERAFNEYNFILSN